MRKTIYSSTQKSANIDKQILKDCLEKVSVAITDGWRVGFAEIQILINRAHKKEPEVFYKAKK